MSKIAPLRVEVRHEIAVVEAGLRRILEACPEFEVLPATPAHLSGLRSEVPAELRLYDHDRALHTIAQSAAPSVVASRTMVMAMNGQELDVRAAIELGIRGYLLVDCAGDEIVQAVRAVAAGHRYLCTAASLRLADKLGQPSLTPREGEVLCLALRGQSNKEMARSLDISVGTVKAHLRTLFSKLGARCRTEALWLAAEKGLLSRPSGPGAEMPAAQPSLPASSFATATWPLPTTVEAVSPAWAMAKRTSVR